VNQNYDQVTSLVTGGQLRWDVDSIAAMLVRNAQYNAGHQRFSELAAPLVTSAPINGRWVGENGEGMGLPAVFGAVQAAQPYQLLIVKDDGRSDPLVLAWLDEDTSSEDISVQRAGSLIVRPVAEPSVVPPPGITPPPTTGLWMLLV
jgi:hypothetical protein